MCTSAYGRLISVMLMILSIFVLALPIAVIGQILTEEMENYVERKATKETRVAKQIGVDESSDLLKKYSTTIERRKSQFNFDLPSELKEKREMMMVKIKSANDVLQRTAVSLDESSPQPVLKRATTFSTPETIDGHSPTKTSASKLFSSWNEDDDDDDDDDDEDEDKGGEHNGMVTQHQVGFVLGGASSSPTQHSPPSDSSPKQKVTSKAEMKWDEKKREKGKRDQSPRTMSPTVNLSVITATSNRKNPMLRSASAKKMGSNSSLSQKKAHEKRALSRSHSSKIRDIDQELVILERNYTKQMLQCTELHHQIVSLMKEKNESLNEALL